LPRPSSHVTSRVPFPLTVIIVPVVSPPIATTPVLRVPLISTLMYRSSSCAAAVTDAKLNIATNAPAIRDLCIGIAPFLEHAASLRAWTDDARAAGHELGWFAGQIPPCGR